MPDELATAARLLAWWVDFVRSTDGTPDEWRPEIWNQMSDFVERNGTATLTQPTNRGSER